MFRKRAGIIYTVLFLLILVIPLCTVYTGEPRYSRAENRMLAGKPVFIEDGKWNGNFTNDAEAWFSDNLGFRKYMVAAEALLEYTVFREMLKKSDMVLGPDGELNYATEPILRSYSHLDKYSKDSLRGIADDYQTVADYSRARGVPFFYFQCWDKHSIYPEYFPRSVLQYGETSKTDGIVRALREMTDVCVISPKEALLAAKETSAPYSVWGDPAHWSQRGAHIGYRMLLETINAELGTDYKVMTEDDYDITMTDQGYLMYGVLHRTDMEEDFQIRGGKGKECSDPLSDCDGTYHPRYIRNERADNDVRMLVIGDSYFNNYIMDDIGESFRETILIWGDYLADFQTILEEYDPDIVVVEAAERVDRSSYIKEAARRIREGEP